MISVVVPTYNRRNSLARLLHALERQTVGHDAFEVIVVDDGSTDATLDVLEAYDPDRLSIRVVSQAHGGPAAARNLGVEKAASDLILFLDDDVVPQEDLMVRHLRWHADSDDLVVIGPMRPPRDWARPVWVRWEEEMLQVQYADMAAGKYPCTPRQFYTANASLPRRRFLAAGGFDPDFKRAEDVELAYRMRDGGARFLFDPDAGVMHYAQRTFAAWAKTPRQYGRYDVLMHREKGHEALWCAVTEFQQRHAVNRVLARTCVGRGPLLAAAVSALRGVSEVADAAGVQRVAIAGLSGIFNLLYWQGVSEELGSPAALWQLVAEWREDVSAATPSLV
jgi:glycosyltransferase involved in cell wall biosynthesis